MVRGASTRSVTAVIETPVPAAPAPRGGAADGPAKPVPWQLLEGVRRCARTGHLVVLIVKLQLLSDLHLETESYAPVPAAGAEVLVLAGDIDTTWRSFELFRDWPVPVLFVQV